MKEQKEFDALYNRVRKAFHLQRHTKIDIKGKILIEIMELDRWDEIRKTVVRVNRDDVEEGYRIAKDMLKFYIKKREREFYDYFIE